MAVPVRLDPKLARWRARESRRLSRQWKRPVSRVEVSRILGALLASFGAHEVANALALVTGPGPEDEEFPHNALSEEAREGYRS